MSSVVIPDVSTELSKFTPTEATIAKMREEFMPLTINGVEDKAGFEACHAARMIVKSRRIDIERLRKELKADALKFGQTVDAEAKRLTALILPIETHLEDQENAVNAEKDRIRNAARLAAEAAEKSRLEAEAARLKAEQDAERERLRVEREKLDAERKAMEAAQAKIDAERLAQEAEKRRLEQIESNRLHAAEVERTRVETEARIAREAAEKIERERAAAAKAEADRLRIESLRPDREKLLAVAEAVAAIDVPEVSGVAEPVAIQVRASLSQAVQRIRSLVKFLG
jgi:chromosome segregation ATPase